MSEGRDIERGEAKNSNRDICPHCKHQSTRYHECQLVISARVAAYIDYRVKMNSANSESDKPASEPNELITGACLHYMMRRGEICDFNELYHRLAKLAITAQPTSEAKALYQEFIRKRQFYLETFLIRSVDIFLQYIVEVLYELFAAHPELMPTRRSSPAPSDFQTSEELLFEQIEAEVSRLSFSKVRDVGKYVALHAGIPIFKTTEEVDFVVWMTALRNVIVHNDGVPDQIFGRRIAGLAAPFPLSDLPGGRIEMDERWVLDAGVKTDGIVFRFDDDVSVAHGLSRRNRFGTFWWR